MVPEETGQTSSIPFVEKKGFWGAVSGIVILLIAIPAAVAVARYRRKRHGTAVGERVNNPQRRSANLGLDHSIKNLRIKGRRFIAQKLNGRSHDNFFYWELCADKCGLQAECESWKQAANPAERFLAAYGERSGSTVRKLVEVLKDPEVDLTQIAYEIEQNFKTSPSVLETKV